MPADPAPRRRSRRAVRPGTEREAVPGPSTDEHDAGWGDAADAPAAGDSGANDDRLRRDVPPHY